MLAPRSTIALDVWRRAGNECRCGQLAIGTTRRCGPCQARDKAPQGQAVRLFEPAPVQLAGQLDISHVMDTTDGIGA